MSKDRFLQTFLMTHVGHYTTQESNRAIKRTKNVHGVIEHTEKHVGFEVLTSAGMKSQLDFQRTTWHYVPEEGILHK
jgi:hypothetical protein